MGKHDSKKKDANPDKSTTPSRGSLPSLSAVSSQPLDPENALLIFEGALKDILELKVLSYRALVKQVDVKRLLESVKDDVERRGKLVHETIGTILKLALAQSKQEGSVEKQAGDIVYMIVDLEDEEAAQRLIEGYGLKELVTLIPLWEINKAMKDTEWMLRDTEVERELACRLCQRLLEFPIYEKKMLVYEHLRNSIGNAAFIADKVPKEKREAILDVIQQAIKDRSITATMLGELIFNAVPLAEWAEYIPAATLGMPFADYVALLDIKEPVKAEPPPLPKKGEGDGREQRLSDAPAVSVGTATEGDLDLEVDDDLENLAPASDAPGGAG